MLARAQPLALATQQADGLHAGGKVYLVCLAGFRGVVLAYARREDAERQAERWAARDDVVILEVDVLEPAT